MSRVSSMLNSHVPWCYSTASSICQTTTDVRFGLNDPLSFSTRNKPAFVHNSNTETANFSNPSLKVIHCLDYGAYVAAIPRPHAQPSQCDRIIYAADSTHFIFAEMKISAKRGVKIRQLTNTIGQLLSIQAIQSFISHFAIKRCCFFNKIPRTLNPLTAVPSFNPKALLSSNKGNRIVNRQHTNAFANHGFELWSFDSEDVCEIS